MTRFCCAVRRKQYWQVNGMESVICMGEEFDSSHSLHKSQFQKDYKSQYERSSNEAYGQKHRVNIFRASGWANVS